jgi:type I restriction-modification system DNA methylase subunit
LALAALISRSISASVRYSRGRFFDITISDWGGERLREDARWAYGTPPVGNANYAWLQHVLWHLAPNGTAGVVLANGSMSSAQSGEDAIRKAMVEADVVDCMVALPGQLFYSTQIPACLWFLARNKNPGDKWRDRRGGRAFALRAKHCVDAGGASPLRALIAHLSPVGDVPQGTGRC